MAGDNQAASARPPYSGRARWAVKHVDRRTSRGADAARGLNRHLEGWPLLPVSVGLALLAVVLVVPRAVEPRAIPLPSVDRLEQQRLVAAQRAALADAKTEPLPFEVREVGEALRRYGSASAEQARNSAAELALLRQAVASARKIHGDEPLLRLLAVQTELFLDALAHWEQDGSENTDLMELGGGLISAAQRNGWSRPPHRLLLTATERATLFRIRWSELTELRNVYPFRPALNEWRIYYRFLLENPEGAPDSPAERAQTQLSYVAALEKRDPDFPAELARGVLYSRLGEYRPAIQALKAHLAAYPTGAWRLRAQNYLAYALEQAQETADFSP